jgi:hypothetical protein
MPEHTTTTIPDTALMSPARETNSESPANPMSENQHSASLKYEHVHRIEITFTLLTGIVGRIRKQG